MSSRHRAKKKTMKVKSIKGHFLYFKNLNYNGTGSRRQPRELQIPQTKILTQKFLSYEYCLFSNIQLVKNLTDFNTSNIGVKSCFYTYECDLLQQTCKSLPKLLLVLGVFTTLESEEISLIVTYQSAEHNPGCNKKAVHFQEEYLARCRNRFFHHGDKPPNSALPGS